MKLRSVAINNRKAQIELTTRTGALYSLPFSRLDPRPTRRNRIRDAYVDRELANEAVTYVLESGAEGVVHSIQTDRGGEPLGECIARAFADVCFEPFVQPGFCVQYPCKRQR